MRVSGTLALATLVAACSTCADERASRVDEQVAEDRAPGDFNERLPEHASDVPDKVPLSCAPAEIADYLQGDAVEDCGEVGKMNAAEDQQDTLRCVRTAWSSRVPFRVSIKRKGTDSRYEQAFVGTTSGDGFVVKWIDFDPTFGFESAVPGSSTAWGECVTFEPGPDCSLLDESCLKCTRGDHLPCGCAEADDGPTVSCER